MASVLIVDDDPRIRGVLARICEQSGLSVSEAADGMQATAIIESTPLELILLDIAMPRMDGMAVLRWLREQKLDPAPAVIIVTALSDVDGKIQGVELGAIDFIEKPFRLPDVERRVRRALSIVALERRLQGAEKALAHLRRTDPVTGVEPTGRLYEVLEAEFLSARVGDRALTCVVVSDEGYSEALNDQGRAAGEARLQHLAERIEKKLRGADRVFRVDASEFVLVLPSTPAPGARRVVDKITAEVMSLQSLPVSELAIAVASYPHPEITQASQLFRAVNITLAQARARDIERIVYFEGF